MGRPTVEQVARTVHQADYPAAKWDELRHVEQEFYRYTARAVMRLFEPETVSTAEELDEVESNERQAKAVEADVSQMKELARQREESINEAARAENRIGAAKTILDEHLQSLTRHGQRPERASQCRCLACDIGRALGVIEEVDRG